MAEILIMFLVMLVVFVILFWLRKSLFLMGFFFKLIMVALLLGVIGSVVFGYMIIKDANNFKNNFGNSTSMFIVRQSSSDLSSGILSSSNSSQSFISGITVNPQSRDFKTMTKDELASVEKLYDTDRLYTLGSQYYKVFVIELKSFDEIQEYNISDQNIELTHDEIKSIMVSKSARDELARIVSEKQNVSSKKVLDDISMTDEEIKGYLLSYYLSSTLNPDNISEFLLQFKKENIKVYAETAMFKAIRFIPNALIKSII